MYVVKRPFRDAAGMVPAGSTVEPAGIKRFKHRLLEGHIVEVNEQNFDRYASYFKQRCGIVLPSLSAEPDVTPDATPETTPAAKPETTPAAKPVVKATVEVPKVTVK